MKGLERNERFLGENFTHKAHAERAFVAFVEELMREEGLTYLAAISVASQEPASAGDDPHGTVESIMTCRYVTGEKCPGLSTHDTVTPREDPFFETDEDRRRMAEFGLDEGGLWLRLTEYIGGGVDLANAFSARMGDADFVRGIMIIILRIDESKSVVEQYMFTQALRREFGLAEIRPTKAIALQLTNIC